MILGQLGGTIICIFSIAIHADICVLRTNQASKHPATVTYFSGFQTRIFHKSSYCGLANRGSGHRLWWLLRYKQLQGLGFQLRKFATKQPFIIHPVDCTNHELSTTNCVVIWDWYHLEPLLNFLGHQLLVAFWWYSTSNWPTTVWLTAVWQY